MDTKSPESVKVITSAEADLGPESLLQLILKLTLAWDIANVRTSCIAVTQDGKRSKLVTITFDADIFEPSVTTSLIKS
jgi:hypothetical protein